MPSSIRMQRQAKGRAPTLLSAAQANMLIDLFNALQEIEVRPAGAGTAVMSGDKMTIDLSTSLGSLDARLTALEHNIDPHSSLLNTITAALANATIVCNANGTITLTFPGISMQSLT